jgi:predicted phosphodiesterase
MRFAAIADIHGNADALEAVLADIAREGITDVVNLGDHLSGPLQARRTADLLMAQAFVSIRGNQDRRMLAAIASGQGDTRVDCRELEAHHVAWLDAQPATLLWREEVFLCHGTPRDDETYWLESVGPEGAVSLRPIEQIEPEAADVPGSLILCAHTHIPRCVRLRDGRMVVNPGSVGLAGYRDSQPPHPVMQVGTPDAAYAICEKRRAGWAINLRTVPYDTRAMVALARARQNAVWASALETGWVRT